MSRGLRPSLRLGFRPFSRRGGGGPGVRDRGRPEPEMTLPRSVAEILRDHVTLEVEGIDRMYLNAVVPILQTEGGIAWFFREVRGYSFASSALMAPMTRGFVDALESFARSNHLDVVTFEKKQRKEDVAAEYLRRFRGEEGLLFVGKAQEKAPVFRTERRKNPHTGASYAWLYRSTAMVNQYYFYAVDRNFGPFFLKFCSYFPYNAKLCINGHEYAKRQLAQRGIKYEALDNGILTCDNPATLQRICDQLSASQIDALLRKWLRRLPHPFTTKDRSRGIRYDVSILQAEFSLTQVLDQPVTGRVFFEEVRRSGRTWTSAAPIRSSSSSTERSYVRGRALHPVGFVPESSRRVSIPRFTWTTRRRGSSSTTRKAVLCARKPPSTTPTTSPSVDGCTTFPHSGRSASRPTDVYSTSNESAMTARLENEAFTPFSARVWWTGSEPPPCASKPSVYRPSCTRSSSFASCPMVSPMPICESDSSPFWAVASPRARLPMIFGACACTRSSAASLGRTATRSPRLASATRFSSLAATTAFSVQDSRSYYPTR